MVLIGDSVIRCKSTIQARWIVAHAAQTGFRSAEDFWQALHPEVRAALELVGA